MSDASENNNSSQGHHKHRKHGKLVVVAGLVTAMLGVGATFAIAQADGHRYGKMGGFGHHGQAAQQMFKQFDTDRDGTITAAEMDARIARTLSDNDGNKDGSLNLAEFEDVWMTYTRFKMVDMFQRLDEDGDGQITEAELTEKKTAMMYRADRDGDGQITKSELRFGHHRHHDDDDDHRYRDDDDRDDN
ncbi:MAG: EF-hand domain-containing protein [Alphaproteobacteria bacterium]